MATSVTAAHHSINWHLYDSMHAAQTPKKKLKFVTLDKESNMSTLWRREDFLRICSKEELAEKAQHIEVTIHVKKSQEALYNLDPGSSFVNRFLGNITEPRMYDIQRSKISSDKKMTTIDTHRAFVVVRFHTILQYNNLIMSLNKVVRRSESH